jgi:hypothetical protein
MKIELLYMQGCLRWKSALARLRQVLGEERVRASVQIIEVNDQLEALRRHFLGSPTIRINDYDIEPEAASRSDFGLGCRTYPDKETLYGVPSKEMIRRALPAGGSNDRKVVTCAGTKSPATSIAPPAGQRVFGHVRLDRRQVR